MNRCLLNLARWSGAWIVAWAACQPPAWAAPEPEVPADSVRFFSEFSGTGRLLFFANHQDELQEDRFLTEGAMALDFNFISFADKLSLRSRFTLLANMGTSVAENLPFSPKETAYEITPFVEYRKTAHLVRFGWNHVCQHLIYKDNETPWYVAAGSNNVPPDVYYNRLFLGAGRREIRPEILRQVFFGGREGGPVPPRVIWYVEAGGYLRSLPGMDEESLAGGNEWTADLTADLRLLLHAADRWLLFANSRTQVLLDTDEEAYARELVQLEAAFDSRGFGLSLVLGAHLLDEHPRDSKEGIIELGAVSYF